MPRRRATRQPKSVSTIRHTDASRPNIPTAEYQPTMTDDDQRAVPVTYPRNTDLDPQLVWRGKDEQDQSDLVAQAPPLYIQEKVHPKVLIDDLLATSRAAEQQPQYTQPDLFADFNGFPEGADRTAYYQYEGNWSNRLILGDSLQVMASLAEREGLRGKVQCIYLDPPYGIKFNSNFQWSTTSRDVRDGNAAHITREPEQVKAFRDTWRDGIHSYLSYLRDRLTVARDLLTETGSIFVQIGDENVHRVRALMDEVFGSANSVAVIAFKKTSGAGSISGKTLVVPQVFDYVVWYAQNKEAVKYRQLYVDKVLGERGASQYQWIETAYFSRHRMNKKSLHQGIAEGRRVFGADNLTSASGVDKTRYPVHFEGRTHTPHPAVWKTSADGMQRLIKARRLFSAATNLSYVRYFDDFPAIPMTNFWADTASSFMADKVYVVQTTTKIAQRCILMTTDPGDLVLDPTCGSGTTAYVAEQWGRRWITIDTSRVALALARARIMGARYPYYLLADSPVGQEQEAKLSRRPPADDPTYGDIRQGFVYQRVPHITLRAIANNAEIDVIWEQYERQLSVVRGQLSVASGHGPPATGDRPLEEWQVPRERPDHWPPATDDLLAEFWELRIARQREIDASIGAKADYEKLYDQPYEDRKTVRVAGPFTVESITPHRTLAVDENGEFIAEAPAG